MKYLIVSFILNLFKVINSVGLFISFHKLAPMGVTSSGVKDGKNTKFAISKRGSPLLKENRAIFY